MTDREGFPITHRAWPGRPHQMNGALADVEAEPPQSAAPNQGELVGETFAARAVQLGVSEAVTDQRAATSVVFVGIFGAIELAVGGERFHLGARDVLTVPQGMAYSAVNAGTHDAVFAVVRSTVDEPAQEVPLTGAHLLRWADYRREFRSAILPRAQIFGHHRLSGPHTLLRSLLGHTVRVPPNQASPWHEIPRDLLFIQLDGEIDFASGGLITLLRPADLLLVRAGTPYSYANFGFGDALFFDIGGRILTPGATSTYYEDDPGWPVRTDAATYKIISDDPAFRAIYGS
jgi:mannose-6-phosphate isomerase-like protein (cupin superfamily)